MLHYSCNKTREEVVNIAIENCTLNGLPIPEDFGISEKEKQFRKEELALAEYGRTKKQERAIVGKQACVGCLFSDWHKDLYGFRHCWCKCE